MFRSNDKQSGLELDLRRGQTYYLRVEIVNVRAFKSAQGRLVKTDPEQGAYEAKQLKPLGEDKRSKTWKHWWLAPVHRDPEADSSREVLTNQDILALKAAGLSDETIITKVRSSVQRFSLTTQDLVQLKKANVSDSVIQAMMETSDQAVN